MVDSVGYNLHKFLRHVQQYCSEHHTYAVKCKNTYGMKNNVQPPLSSHCFILESPRELKKIQMPVSIPRDSGLTGLGSGLINRIFKSVKQ